MGSRLSRCHLPAAMTVLLLSWLLLNVQLAGRSLWTDELFTAEWTQLPAPDLIERTAHDFHPPLYFWLVNQWTAVTGRGDFALRWFSVAVGVVFGVALLNYYAGRDFLNPIYLTPARQMVDFVLPQLQPDDIIYSDWDSGFDHYYRQTGMPALSFTDAGAARGYVEAGRARRVWLVVLGRDQSERSVVASSALRE
jgi:hypothetical protein